MKVASLALVLVATTQASLFEDMDEDYGLQQEYSEFDDDRNLQMMDENDDLDESDPEIMIEGPSSDDEVNRLEEGNDNSGVDDRSMRGRGGQRQRGGGRRRNNRRCRDRRCKGKGRRGRKNRKNKKGTFNIEKFLANLEKKEDKMEGKLEDQCERKLGWSQKICSQLPEKTDCQKWALAQEIKCQAYGNCKIENIQDKGKCMGEFKHMMLSFMNDQVAPRPNISEEDIGQCFTDVLREANSCVTEAASKYSTAMQGVVELSEEELTAAKAGLKDQRKLKRQERRKQKQQRRRRNTRGGNNRRNSRQRRTRRYRNQYEDEEEFMSRGRRGRQNNYYEQGFEPEEFEFVPRRFN